MQNMLKFNLRYRFNGVLIFIFVSVTLIVPNTLREFVLPLFFLLPLLVIFDTKILFENKITIVWYLWVLVTIIYLYVGRNKSYEDSFEQIVFAYILSPIIWSIILYYMFQNYRTKNVVLLLLYLSIIGTSTVPLFIIFFHSQQTSLLKWFILTPNMQFEKDQAAMTMHIFGVYLFIIPAFLSNPTLIKSKVIRIATFCLFTMVTILSGRTALFLAYGLGIFFFIMKYCYKKRISIIFVFILAVVFSIYSLNKTYDINAILIVKKHIAKIMDGGGLEREMQRKYLLNGAFDNFLLGAGHGVSVEIIRNEEYPWRYELLWCATLYRVGLIGSIIYALPFIIVFYCYWKIKISKTRINSQFDDFMFIGMISSLISSYTNPYYESFQFQWMIFLPFIYFLRRYGMLAYNKEKLNSETINMA